MTSGVYERKLRVGYIDDNGTGHVPLTVGKEALCNAHDFHRVSQFNWFANRNKGRWYARRNITLSNGKRTAQSMHRLIMGEPEGMEIDHIDRSPEGGLDNRTENLRITANQNQQNVGLRKDNASGQKGVYWRKDKGKWQVQITHNGKRINLGLFDTLLEAAQAYNEAALLYHKEFAYQNDLSQITQEQLAA